MNRPLPLDPVSFDAKTAHFDAATVGAITRVALHFWETGEVPGSTLALAKLARVSPKAIEGMLPDITPFFERGGLFPILRQAAIAKSARRAAAGRLGGLKRHRAAVSIQ